MAGFMWPMLTLLPQFRRAYDRALFDCDLEEYMATYAMQWVSPPTQPYVAVHNVGDPEVMKRGARNPFAHTLPPVDLARLAADPTKQARWTNLVLHTMLPPLRELDPIIASKVHQIRSPRHRPAHTLKP
jgi:hypothetical protein